MATTTELQWAAQDTEPAAVEAALRRLLVDVHAENPSYVPARVLNLVCIVDHAFEGEIANRLARVGRYNPSRTVLCAVQPGRATLDAVATIAAPAVTKPGEYALTRESVTIEMGTQHLRHIDTIVDPVVVPDIPTLVWSPHGHHDVVDRLLRLAQIVLLDSVDAVDCSEAIARARTLAERAYVVDLAWLRSTPWRERIAATFDPELLRRDLPTISAVTVRHHPRSRITAMLLIGWLASRLGWQLSPLAGPPANLHGTAQSERQEITLRVAVAPEQQVRGLAGVVLETAGGRHLSYDRAPGGLRATYCNRRGDCRTWTILGASRGESGVLGEGIRQALLRDPTYRPALEAAAALVT